MTKIYLRVANSYPIYSVRHELYLTNTEVLDNSQAFFFLLNISVCDKRIVLKFA